MQAGKYVGVEVRGIWMDVNSSLLLEGQTPAHQWIKAKA